MVLDVQSAEIIGIKIEPVIIKTQEFENKNTKKANFSVEIKEDVSETVSFSWNTGGTLHIEQMIKYGIEFLGTGGGGETTLSYEQSWNTGGEKSKTVIVGSSSATEVELEPGDGVIVELSASRGFLNVRIHYVAHLEGKAVTHWTPKLWDSDYWSTPIYRIMDAGKIPLNVNSFEDIKVAYYSNSNITVRDKKTQEVIATFMSDEISSASALISLSKV